MTPPGRCKITHSRIEIFDLDGGGKEFVAPVMRNFREKIPFTILRLVFAACFAGFGSGILYFVGQLPFAWARFLAVNLFFSFFGFLGLFVFVIGIICFDLWFRSTRVIAVPGELHVVTHWLFFQVDEHHSGFENHRAKGC